MRKLVTMLLLSMFLAVPFSLATIVKQSDADNAVDAVIKSSGDYLNLIRNINVIRENKIKHLMSVCNIDNTDENYHTTFKALYHSSGFRSYLKSVSGRHYANTARRHADMYDPAPPEPVPPAEVCGNGVMEGSEACDDGNTTDGDGCSSTCQIEVP